MSALERWQEEMQSAWLYRVIAKVEPDRARSKLFTDLAGAAEQQADILAGDLRSQGGEPPAFQPGARARVAAWLARRLGPRRLRPVLAALKVRGMSVYDGPAEGHPMHASVEEVGSRHRRGGGGNLRAAVFGVNDGLVSNASLIMGVAGATTDPAAITLAGVAGLLAGAFSMASGEYVSMRTQREMYEYQIGQERDELERYPQEEAEELALIYEARGVPLERARELAALLVRDKEHALFTLAREELGLNPDDLGSPWGAALSSFAAFTIGAALPLAPFLVHRGPGATWAAAGVSAAGLFAVGTAMSLFSGRRGLLGGLRMLLIGASAGAVTYLIGHLLGVSLG